MMAGTLVCLDQVAALTDLDGKIVSAEHESLVSGCHCGIAEVVASAVVGDHGLPALLLDVDFLE